MWTPAACSTWQSRPVTSGRVTHTLSLPPDSCSAPSTAQEVPSRLFMRGSKCCSTRLRCPQWQHEREESQGWMGWCNPAPSRWAWCWWAGWLKKERVCADKPHCMGAALQVSELIALASSNFPNTASCWPESGWGRETGCAIWHVCGGAFLAGTLGAYFTRMCCDLDSIPMEGRSLMFPCPWPGVSLSKHGWWTAEAWHSFLIHLDGFWIQSDQILTNTLNFVVAKATLWTAKATPHSVLVAILLLCTRQLSLWGR